MTGSRIPRPFSPTDAKREREEMARRTEATNGALWAASTAAAGQVKFTNEELNAAIESTRETLAAADAAIAAAQVESDAAQAELTAALALNAEAQEQLAADMGTLQSTTLPALSTDLTAAKGRLADAEADLTAAFGQLGTVDGRITTAKNAAIATAATTAQTKADAAKAAAIAAAAADATAKKEQAEANAATAAAADATSKADAAQVAALAAAKTYADAQASGAGASTLAAAKADATAKADAAKAAAISAAAADATAKKEQAEANAATDASAKANAAQAAAIAAAATTAQTKANAAEAAAKAAAAADATAKTEAAEARAAVLAASTAQTKADAAQAAALAAAKTYADAQDSGANASTLAAAKADATTKADAAKAAAITAAAADATAKKEQAEATAAADASTKANAAQAAAISAAATTAQTKANAAQAAAITAAAADATSKAAAAEAAAKTAAATDAQTKATAAQAAAIAAAATTAQIKADAARDGAISTAEATAIAKANAAQAAATAVANTAQTTANTAQTAAATAASAALAAQNTADTAKTNAATAQSAANTAQGTANTAVANAGTAQTAADLAKTNAATAQTAANAAAVAADKALVSAGKSYRRAGTDPAGIVTGQSLGASGLFSAASDGAPGGFALQKSALNSGNVYDTTAMQDFDPNALYRVSFRVRMVTAATNGAKVLYAGILALKADGTTGVSTTGVSSWSSAHYFAANNMALTLGVWTTVTGYFRGHADTGNGGPRPLPTAPGTVHAATRKIMPMMLMDYASGNGVWELGAIELDVVSAEGLQALDAAAAAQTKANTAAADVLTAQARADAAHGIAGTAEANAQTAISSAGAAQLSANNVSKNLFSTGNPAGSAPYGSTWFKVNGTGEVIGQWQQTAAGIASTWTVRAISSEVIANLDVGKLVAGTAVIGNAVALKIAAATASFQEVDIGNLTVTGTSKLADLVAQQVAADSGKFISLAVGQLTAGTGSMAVGVIDKLYADVVMSRKVLASQVIIGRGANMIPNGSAELGTNEGWPSVLTYDAADKPPGLAASFSSAVAAGTVSSAMESVPVEPLTDYLFEIWIKADKPNSKFYFELRDQGGVHGGVNTAITGFEHGLAPGVTAYPISAYTVPTVWTKLTANLKTTATANRLRVAAMYFNHSAGTERTAKVWLAGLSLRPRVGGTLVADNSITAPHIVASEALTAKMAQFLKVTAQNIDVDVLWAESAWITKAQAHLLQVLSNTDGSGYTSTVTGQGIQVTYTQKDAGGATVRVQPVVQLGTFGDDLISLYKNGKATFLANAEGDVAAKTITATDEMYYKGDKLSELLYRMPRGHVSAAVRTTDQNFNSVSNNPEQPYLRLDVELECGRLYKVWTSPIAIGVSPGQTGIVRLRGQSGGVATTTSPIINDIGLQPEGAAGVMQEIWTPAVSGYTIGEKRQCSFIISNITPAGGGESGIRASATRPVRLEVEDIGPLLSTGNGVHLIGANQSIPAPTPPPARVTYDRTLINQDRRTYDGAGNQYTWPYPRGGQGQSPAGYGNLRSIWTFQNILPDLSGTTIHEVWAYFKFDQWYNNAGGTARIGLHGTLTLPSTYGATSNTPVVTSGGWPAGADRWVKIPEAHYGGFANGTWRGFTLIGDSTSSTYGLASNSQLRIVYSKAG